ncbi:MAG: hypothetical protein AVDCRST_MAG13-2092, partial [uncultured Solirubrobacteraceae bacterium]
EEARREVRPEPPGARHARGDRPRRGRLHPEQPAPVPAELGAVHRVRCRALQGDAPHGAVHHPRAGPDRERRGDPRGRDHRRAARQRPRGDLHGHPPAIHADLPRRVRARAPQDGPERHGHRARAGLAVLRRAPAERAHPRLADPVQREPRRDPRGARQGHPHVPAAAHRGRRAGARRQRPPAVGHAQALRAHGRPAAPGDREGGRAPAERRPGDPLVPPAVGDPGRQGPRPRPARGLLQRGVRLLRQGGGPPARDRPRAAARAALHHGRAHPRRRPGPRARARHARPAPDGAPPRPRPAGHAALPARDDARGGAPAAPVRPRDAARGPDPAPRRARPRAGHPGPHPLLPGGQLPPEHPRLRQAARRARLLPLLARVGQPPGQHALRHPGRQRPDPQGRRAGLVREPRRPGEPPAGQRAARRPGRPAQRAHRPRGLPRARRRHQAAGGHGRPAHGGGRL